MSQVAIPAASRTVSRNACFESPSIAADRVGKFDGPWRVQRKTVAKPFSQITKSDQILSPQSESASDPGESID